MQNLTPLKCRFISLISILLACLVSCKTRKEIDGNGTQLKGDVKFASQQAPNILYHFGESKYLVDLESLEGEDLQQKLREFPSFKYDRETRRGIYGSQHPVYAERYAFEHFGSGTEKSPWIVAFQVAPRCLESGKVAPSLLARESAQNDNVMKAINVGGFKTHQDFVEECFDSKNEMRPGCDSILKDVFSASDVKVSYDNLWPYSGFWIIRDSSCIEKVISKPASILASLSNESELWNIAPFNNRLPRHGIEALKDDAYTAGTGLYFIVAKALVANPLDSTVIQRILNGTSDGQLTTMARSTEKLIHAALACQQAGAIEAFKSVLADRVIKVIDSEPSLSGDGSKKLVTIMREASDELIKLECAATALSKFDDFNDLQRDCKVDVINIASAKVLRSMNVRGRGDRLTVQEKALAECRSAIDATSTMGCKLAVNACQSR